MIAPVTGNPLVTRARRETYTQYIVFSWFFPVTPVTPVTECNSGPEYARGAVKFAESITGPERIPVTTRYKPDRVFKLTAIAPDRRGDRVTGEPLAHAIKGGRPA